MLANRSALGTRLAASVVLVITLAGCSGQPDLPPADRLLASAAEEMRRVSTVAFNLEVAGPLGTLAIRRAQGVLTREGELSGVVSLELSGSLIEYEVVVSGETTYVKGPTGGFQALPTAISNAVFDPTSLLDPSGGLALALARMEDARTEAAEAVEGTDAYRVRATIPAEVLEDLLPVELGEGGVASVAWIGAEVPVVLKLHTTIRIRGETQSTVMTVMLDDFNVPATITPPPT
jgi:lipoprotein LprG